ncbi:MAG TPA: hypothetical protein VNH11_27370 [Pirellulales bacterium]|nr:hypothetical protein [Pirellulales bacterium]
MIDPEHEPTHRPREGAAIATIGFGIRVTFYPELRLERKRGHEFAAVLSEFLSIDSDEIQSHRWSFVAPLAGANESRMNIVVNPNSAHIDFRSPHQETAELKFTNVLEALGKHFEPKIILQSSAIVRGTLDIDGDSRQFVAAHLMNMPESRHEKLGRPLHLLGIRVLCPPFKRVDPATNQESAVEWSVNLRVESLIEDVRKLFIEADADWFDVSQWDSDVVEKKIVTQHLDDVKKYLDSSVLSFLVGNGHDISPDGGGNL